jgi:hypothetical protein
LQNCQAQSRDKREVTVTGSCFSFGGSYFTTSFFCEVTFKRGVVKNYSVCKIWENVSITCCPQTKRLTRYLSFSQRWIWMPQ